MLRNLTELRYRLQNNPLLTVVVESQATELSCTVHHNNKRNFAEYWFLRQQLVVSGSDWDQLSCSLQSAVISLQWQSRSYPVKIASTIQDNDRWHCVISLAALHRALHSLLGRSNIFLIILDVATMLFEGEAFYVIMIYQNTYYNLKLGQ